MRQQGSALLVSLILLLILTVAGLAAINSSSLEEKVTGNFRDQQVAFHAGEAALLEAEQYVDETDFSMAEFTSACNHGLCFAGINPGEVSGCSANAVSPWRDEALWGDSSRVKALVLNLDGTLLNAWYIVEFRCYLPRENEGPDPDITDINEWSQFFRITVRANGGSQNTRVMLQTTYKKNN